MLRPESTWLKLEVLMRSKIAERRGPAFAQHELQNIRFCYSWAKSEKSTFLYSQTQPPGRLPIELQDIDSVPIFVG